MNTKKKTLLDFVTKQKPSNLRCAPLAPQGNRKQQKRALLQGDICSEQTQFLFKGTPSKESIQDSIQ